MKLGIAEILDLVEKTKNKKAKIEILQKNGTAIHNLVLFNILKIAFEQPEWDIPEGLVEYRPCPFVDQYGNLYQNYKLIPRHFLKGSNPILTPEKRLKIYVEFLENLDKDDAVLIESIRNGLMPYPSVTKKLIEEAFPGLIEDVKEVSE